MKIENNLVCDMDVHTELIPVERRELFGIVQEEGFFINTGESYFIFKHSNICPISEKVYNKVLCALKEDFFGLRVFLIVVQEQRSLSDFVTTYFNVKHESPQLLRIENKKVVEVLNHFEILENRV